MLRNPLETPKRCWEYVEVGILLVFLLNFTWGNVDIFKNWWLFKLMLGLTIFLKWVARERSYIIPDFIGWFSQVFGWKSHSTVSRMSRSLCRLTPSGALHKLSRASVTGISWSIAVVGVVVIVFNHIYLGMIPQNNGWKESLKLSFLVKSFRVFSRSFCAASPPLKQINRPKKRPLRFHLLKPLRPAKIPAWTSWSKGEVWEIDVVIS